MKKIVYISGSRSDYSPMRLTLMKLDKLVDLTVIATCMHLSPKFGLTVKEIEKDGLKIKKVYMFMDNKDSLEGMVESFSTGILGTLRAIEEISPNIIFLEGDRGESLAGATVGAYLNTPIVHHGGGDRSGSIDNKIRNAITMLADYHLAGNRYSYRQLLKMGIPKEKLFLVGEPGLDDVYSKDFCPKKEIIKKYGINPKNPCILLIQHPNTNEYRDAGKQIKETLNAIKELRIQTIGIYSNADAGGRIINKTLEEYSKNSPFLKVYPHIERKEFLGLMNTCDLMVGNSSAGIVELPSFKKPFVCIGTREKRRLRAGNIIDVGYKKKEITDAINKALNNKEFKKRLEGIRNPYGDGKSSSRIVEIIFKIVEQDKNFNQYL